MKNNSRSILIFTILFGYIILQFLWWEVLLVRQANDIINEKQKIIELTSTDADLLKIQIEELHHKKQMRTYMIVGEGTVFLLLLLFGIYKIKQAYNRETQLVQLQKNFLLSVTHELKTPIASAKLQLQTLLKHPELDTEKQKELITGAVNETNRLNRLIEDVLLANQAENNNLKINRENFNVSELTEHILKNYFPAERIKSNVEENLFYNCDKLLFPSIIINLVENAIKYSSGNEPIKINLQNKNGKLLLEVFDNGIGIPDNEKQNVFQKFYRIGNEETRNAKGTGLGLYIVKKIADAHHARIVISNNNPKGTVVNVEF